MDLKLAQYYGNLNSGLVNLAYAPTERGIFFTGIQIAPNSSTTRCLASVVNAITIDARIRWQDHAFFDVQTHQGYPGTDEGWCAIYRLEIAGDEETGKIKRVLLHIVAMATHDATTDDKIIEAIPEEVRPAFFAHIG